MTQTVAAAPSPLANPASGKVFQEAYDRHFATIAAVPADQALQVNLEINGAVALALGIQGTLDKLREQAAKLPGYAIEDWDNLDEYARALAYVEARYDAATAPPADLPALHTEGIALRQILTTDATALAGRGRIDPARLAHFKGLTGYENVASDLLSVATVLREVLKQNENKTAVEPAELDRAEQLADLLLVGSGKKKVAPSEKLAEAALLRQQAFTVFVNSYDQVRRAVIFLRWNEGDADELVPSLYAKHTTSGRGKREGSSDASGSEKAKDGAAQPRGPDGAPVDPGMPGNKPFVKPTLASTGRPPCRRSLWADAFPSTGQEKPRAFFCPPRTW